MNQLEIINSIIDCFLLRSLSYLGGEKAMTHSNLINSVKIDITYEHYLRLEAIDLHDFSLVKKKIMQENQRIDEDEADEGVKYLKRYYAILVLDTLNPPAMTLPVDPYWHNHVLLSQDYTAFCGRVFGEYVHHIPLLYADDMAVEFVKDFYERTREKHLAIFGDADEHFFPTSAGAGLCCSPSSIGTNVILRELALFPSDKFLHLNSASF
jgi:hypothetical protein